MQANVETLYEYILKFLMRAMTWCSEGTFKHIISATIRPYDLRFRDILDDITRTSRDIDQVESMESQIELRRVRDEQRDLKILGLDMRIIISEAYSLNIRGFAESNRRLCYNVKYLRLSLRI